MHRALSHAFTGRKGNDHPSLIVAGNQQRRHCMYMNCRNFISQPKSLYIGWSAANMLLLRAGCPSCLRVDFEGGAAAAPRRQGAFLIPQPAPPDRLQPPAEPRTVERLRLVGGRRAAAARQPGGARVTDPLPAAMGTSEVRCQALRHTGGGTDQYIGLSRPGLSQGLSSHTKCLGCQALHVRVRS